MQSSQKIAPVFIIRVVFDSREAAVIFLIDGNPFPRFTTLRGSRQPAQVRIRECLLRNGFPATEFPAVELARLKAVGELHVQGRRGAGLPVDQQRGEFSDEFTEYTLITPAAQAAALDDQASAEVDQNVVLGFEADHTPEPAVVGKVNALRQFPGQRVNEVVLVPFRLDSGGDDEIHAVGIGFDEPGVPFPEHCHKLPRNLLAVFCDPRSRRVVIEVCPSVRQVSVERVDQDLVTSLNAVPVGPVGIGFGVIQAGFGLEASLGQALQHGQEHVFRIGTGTYAVLQHDGRVEALHVGLDNPVENARGKQLGISAPERLRALRSRNGEAPPEIGADHQGVDLLARTGNCSFLKPVWQHLGLVEFCCGDHFA